MRVGFDAGPALAAPSGIGRYAQELRTALAEQSVEVVPYAISWRAPSDPEISRWRVPASLMYRWWERVPRPRLSRLVGDVDVVHATNFMLPPTGAVPGVVTVHDMSFYRPDVGGAIAQLRRLVPAAVARAARVVVPTAAVGDEVRHAYGVAEEKVVVTHEGVAPHFFGASPLSSLALESMRIRPPFAVAVGTRQPRKNLHRLVEAWGLARRQLPGWQLVIAGAKGWGPDVTEAPAVVVTGGVADETLPGLLAAADLFCYPSLYEGFGLPPLEAMAAGTAVVCGRYPAAEEVLGDAAVLVDPTDVRGLAAALVDLGRDAGARQAFVRKGRICAAGYTWAACASATIGAYRGAIGS